MQDIIVWNGDHRRLTFKGGPNFGTRMTRQDWGKQNLGLDDKFTFAFNDIWSPPKSILISAHMAVVVEYKIPFIPKWEREKTFPLSTKRQSNGNFYWFAHAPPN